VVGGLVGALVGDLDGALVGLGVGSLDGFGLGTLVGAPLDSIEGAGVGGGDGPTTGAGDGSGNGTFVGGVVFDPLLFCPQVAMDEIQAVSKRRSLRPLLLEPDEEPLALWAPGLVRAD
jgi:hypothetical protein